MAPPNLYLGPKVTVDSSGNVNFTSAVLTSGSSTLPTKSYVDTIVARIDSDIAFMRSNTDAASIDSFTEIVQRASQINDLVSSEVADRIAAVSAEAAARVAAVSAEEAARIAAVDAEAAARAAAVSAEEAARIAAVSAEAAARAADVSAEAATRVSEVSRLDGRVDTEIAARVASVAQEVSDRTSEDAKLRALSRRPVVVMPMEASVYADGKQPVPKEISGLTDLASVGYDGWYYTNAVTGDKINWYAPTQLGLVNSDVQALYLHLQVINKVSSPFVTVYTQPRSGYPSAAGASGWYKCRKTYIVNDSSTLSNLTNYTFVVKTNNSATLSPPKFNHTSFDLTLDEFSSKYKNASGVSVDLADDSILFFSIGSNSSSSAGNVKFILSGFDVQTSNGVFPFVFSNSQVLEKFNIGKVQALYNYFFNKNILGADNTFVPSNA